MRERLPDRKRALHLGGLVVLVAVLVPFVIYAVPGVIGGEASYVVLSGSMEPSISSGDVVIVDETHPTSIEEGDVITYTREEDGTPTTHRVIDVIEGDDGVAFETQGDANDQPDSTPVSGSQVTGTVMLTIPYIGYVISFVNTPLGFGVLVIVPLVALVVSEVASFVAWRDDSTDDETETPDSSGTADEPAGPQTDDASTRRSHREPGNNTDEDTIAITRSDLRLSLCLLFGTTIYTGWVVATVQAAWSFAVLFASALGLLLVGAMYYLAGDGGETGERLDDDASESRSPGARPTESNDPTVPADRTVEHSSAGVTVAERSLLTADGEYPQVTVDSVETIHDEWVIEEIGTGDQYLFRGEIVHDWHPETTANGTANDGGREQDGPS